MNARLPWCVLFGVMRSVSVAGLWPLIGNGHLVKCIPVDIMCSTIEEKFVKYKKNNKLRKLRNIRQCIHAYKMSILRGKDGLEMFHARGTKPLHFLVI